MATASTQRRERKGVRLVVVLAVLLGVALGGPPTAAAAGDPGRWDLEHVTPVPLEYYQGAAADPYGNLYFDGIFTGVFRARPVENPVAAPPDAIGDRLASPAWVTRESARNDTVIPPHVTAVEGYEHVGDLAWAPSRAGDEPLTAPLLGDHGRLLVPVECYAAHGELDSKVCPDAPTQVFPDPLPDQPLPSTGAIAVVDAETLLWQYYVKLDAGALRKAMWAALSPNGKLLWTQGGAGTAQGGPGADLLAFPVSEIVRENASEPGIAGRALKPKVILRGAVPTRVDAMKGVTPMQISGATFFDGRLYVATQGPTDDDGSSVFRLWSLEVDTCSVISGCDRRLEIEQRIVGESEGLETTCAFGGVLHWLVAPNNDDKVVPTFWGEPYLHLGRSTLMTFAPSDGEGVARVCDR
jgi:hypothetical protein